LEGKQMKIETRSFEVEARSAGGQGVISGRAAKYSAISEDLGGFVERIRQEPSANPAAKAFTWPGTIIPAK
jgi:hypothetical protein